MLIGMAVGVDYSLFFLRRDREERARGRSFRRHCRRLPHLRARHPGVWRDRDDGARRADPDGTGPFAASRPAPSRWSPSRYRFAHRAARPAVLARGPRADKGRIPFIGRGVPPPAVAAVGGLVGPAWSPPVVWGGLADVKRCSRSPPQPRACIGQPAMDAPAGLPVVPTMNAIEARVSAEPRHPRRSSSPART